MKQVPITVWYGCYDRQWSGVLSPDSFRHPAKFAPGLVSRLLDYGIAKGWWKPGQKLGDPFGGVGCGAIPAADRGFEWIGSELEKQFVTIATGMDCPGLTKSEWVRWFGRFERNPAICPRCQRTAGAIDRDYWHGHKVPEIAAHRYVGNLERRWKDGVPAPKLVQGDSRRFADVVRSAAGIVTSPPFQTRGGGAQGIAIEGVATERRTDQRMRERTYLGQDGERDAANIEKLEPGTIDAAVTSPPYDTMVTGAGGLNTLPPKKPGQDAGRSPTSASQDFADDRYGDDPAQIAKLKRQPLDAVLTSPAYGDSNQNYARGRETIEWEKGERAGMKNDNVGGKGAYGGDEADIATLKVDALVTSPPYADSLRRQADGIVWKDAIRETNQGGEHQKPGRSLHSTYGDDPAQIANLSAVVTSPPYDRNLAKGHVGADKFADPEKAAEIMAASGKGHSASPAARQAQLERDRDKTYGDSEGQINGLPSGTIDGAVTSPPYEQGLGHGGGSGKPPLHDTEAVYAASMRDLYGRAEGQIGRAAGETYWQAMAKVYASCLEAIKPGGYMAVVVKDYVRDWKRVPLCDDTLRLLEHVGFEAVERIHAMVVVETRHLDLFEGETIHKKERKSFFRRLQEEKGSPPIDYEEVLVVRKPI